MVRLVALRLFPYVCVDPYQFLTFVEGESTPYFVMCLYFVMSNYGLPELVHHATSRLYLQPQYPSLIMRYFDVFNNIFFVDLHSLALFIQSGSRTNKFHSPNRSCQYLLVKLFDVVA